MTSCGTGSRRRSSSASASSSLRLLRSTRRRHIVARPPPSARPANGRLTTSDQVSRRGVLAHLQSARLGEGEGGHVPKVVITMPAYRAEHTLEKTIADIPEGVADQLILVDDASPDDTVR